MNTLTKEEVQAVSDLKAGYALGHADVAILQNLTHMLLASLNATPIYQVQYGQQWRDVSKEVYEDHRDHGSSTRIVYAEPPAPVVNEFIPKNLDRALGVVGVALPESREEFNFQTERWIQRLIDRVIRYADEFKEQPAPVVPDYASFEEFWSSFEHPFAEDDELKSFAVEIWNACRSAMLNGGKS